MAIPLLVAFRLSQFIGYEMKLKTLSLLSVGIATSIGASSVLASEEVVVTGTYSPVSVKQLAAAVSVIDRDELLQLSSHSLVDALRQVPSIWIEQLGGPGGLAAITLRGAESNHTLVLVDGVQMNDPTNSRGGAFDLGSININSIARIEIIRGAQSSIYGSDALAGVVHIITVEATEEARQNLYVGLGNDGYKTASLTSSGKLHNLSYVLKAQTKDAGEPVPGSTAENDELMAKLGWQKDMHTIDFSYRYFDGEKTSFPEQSGGPLLAQSRDLDETEFTDQNSALNWGWQISDQWRSQVQGSWYHRDEEFTSPGVAPFAAVPPNGAETDFTRTSLRWINTVGDENSFWSNVGVETRKESGSSQGYLDMGFMVFPTDFDLSRRVDSLFLNVNRYFGEDLLLQGSLRRDDPENMDANTSGQVGARFQLKENLTWFATWGEGFKLPSFFALGHPLVGNPDLKPETSTTWDTGLEWTGQQIAITVNYFDTRYRDLVDFDSELFTNVNRNRVSTSGAEAEARWQSTDNRWQWNGHASYTDIDAQNPLMNRPQLKAGSTVGYSLSDSWHFDLHYLWVDERFATSYYSGDLQRQTLDSYGRFDGSVNWRVNPKLDINLSVENLTDEDYLNDIGFPNAGRAFHLSASFSL